MTTARGFLTMLATAVAGGVAFYVLRDHWGHVLGFAPYLLFLACPLMHLFMHHGHKHPTDAPKSVAATNEKKSGAGRH
jgi:hypothetical protein